VPRPKVAGAVGPLIVATAVWCATGAITIASPDAASQRLALPAPWWVFAVALAAAALVPEWRRRPLAAAPALLSTLPWWPVPLPPLALIWTGPLAWAPIAASLASAMGPWRPASAASGAWRPASAALGPWRPASAGRGGLLASILTFAACGAVAWNVDARVPGGDEPHYLVITQSLLKDGDIRIENNHRQRDYAEYFGGAINPDYVKRGRDGEIYSVHAPGLPALVLPAFALFGYRGVEVFLLLLAAVAGGVMWRIGWRLTGDAGAAWFGWAAVAGSATFVLHSFTVFPDPAGALIVAVAVLFLIRLDRSPDEVRAAEVVGVSVLLAALPWLHTRFSLLAGGFGLLALLLMPRARRVIFLIVPVLSAAAWFGFFQWVYGTPNPAVPYGGADDKRAEFIPGGLTGLLFDEQFGLIVHAPVLLLAAAAVGRSGAWKARRVELGVLAIAAVYLTAAAAFWLWWAGTPASPARFALAVLPVLVPALALYWHTAGPEARRAGLGLLAVSVTIAAVLGGVNYGALGWNMRDAQAAWLEWLGPVVNLPRAWPSFFWKLDPARLSTEVPFALHAAVWLAAFASAWFALRRAGGGVWLLAGVMMAAQAGWWLNGVSGLDAARSQARVLAASGAVIEIAPVRVRRLADLSNAIVMRTEEPLRLEGTRPWLVVDRLPAGTYNLRISTPRPRAGALTVQFGRTALPAHSFAIQALNRQTEAIVLPVGVRNLMVVPSESLAGLAGSIDLQPVRVERGGVFAQAARDYGPARVYFFDDNVDIETEGFWVRGGVATSLAIGGGSAVTLQNGRGDNEVVVGAARERFGSFETKRLALPPAVNGLSRVTIQPTSGFRPSDDGTSQDTRYLGVFVRVEP
jgi:hypothetical protein